MKKMITDMYEPFLFQQKLVIPRIQSQGIRRQSPPLIQSSKESEMNLVLIKRYKSYYIAVRNSEKHR